MIKRKPITFVTFVTVGLIFLVASPYVQAGWDKWNRLDGTWLRSSVVGGEAGNPPHSLIVITPKNLLGTKAAFRGSFIDPQKFLPTGLPEYVTDFVGEAVMTGPSTYDATAYAYVVMPAQEQGLRGQIMMIIQANASCKFVNENSIEGSAIGSVFLASQDSDGDLIPDLGQVPIATIEEAFVDKRVPMAP